MTAPHTPWTSKNPLSGLNPQTPAIAARQRVLRALEEIEQFDTDRDFILRARARYLDITNAHPEPVNCNSPRADGGADICMAHTGINIGTT